MTAPRLSGTAWTDPQGNLWTLVGTGWQWVAGGLQLPGTASTYVRGPAGLGPTVANGFDLRLRVRWSGVVQTALIMGAPAGFGVGPFTFLARVDTTRTYVALYDGTGANVWVQSIYAAALGNPAVGDWINVRFTLNPVGNVSIGYVSVDGGITWSQATVTNTGSAVSMRSDATHVFQIGHQATVAWADLRTFAGAAPLASIDLTHQWGVRQVGTLSPSSGQADAVTLVNIAGRGLGDATGVRFGSTPGLGFSVATGTDGMITVTAPALRAGTVTVTVQTPDGDVPAGSFTYVAAPTCNRKAWLTLGALSMPLEDVKAGYFCSNLDLGYPDVRDVTSNKPDQDGTDDRTAYFGARVVSADITAIAGAGARIDEVAAAFAPFTVPSARPVLHYVLDRDGLPERTMVLRPSGYDWPIAGPFERDISLQWVAPDPAALDPTVQSATAWAGSSTQAGRTYPLTFNRIYPPGGGSATYAYFRTVGDMAIRPRYRIYGPATGPAVFITQIGPAGVPYLYKVVAFLATFTVGSGQYVDVDSWNKTATLNGDPTQSVVGSIDWQNSLWTPVIPNPAPVAQSALSMTATSTSGVTQVQMTWQDRYLT